MRLRDWPLAMALLVGISGCGGASIILKPPIVDRCSSAGLKGCEQITDGVIQWVEGHKDEGRDLIERGAAKNAPKEVRTFSTGLRLVANMPGMESYAQDLKSIADVLEDQAPAKAKSEPVAQSDAKTLDVTRVRAGAINPANGTDCSTPMGASRCQRALIGPAVVASLVFSGRCGVGSAAIVGDLEQPRWEVAIPANTAMGLTSLALPLTEGERLTIAVAAGGGSECEVAWIAHRL